MPFAPHASPQRRRSETFKTLQKRQRDTNGVNPRRFDYTREYRKLDLREHPELYRVGVGEQGVLLVEPYKSEILPYWRFKTPVEAKSSAIAILKLFRAYRRKRDVVGMDMARKFLQMGYTRSRRYANHASGRKYSREGKVLPFKSDPIKAKSAEIFRDAWKRVEADLIYSRLKASHREKFG
jgi:hypothetical protein